MKIIVTDCDHDKMVQEEEVVTLTAHLVYGGRYDFYTPCL